MVKIGGSEKDMSLNDKSSCSLFILISFLLFVANTSRSGFYFYDFFFQCHSEKRPSIASEIQALF